MIAITDAIPTEDLVRALELIRTVRTEIEKPGSTAVCQDWIRGYAAGLAKAEELIHLTTKVRA